MNLIRTTETKIKPGQILATRATGDHEIIYSLRVISRTPKTAQIEYEGKIRKAKIDEWNGVEFICPQRYSMCPSFYANQVLAA